MNNPDDDDIIEIESSTDRKNDLKSEDKTEAEDVASPLNAAIDFSENETKKSEPEQLKKEEGKACKIAE